MQAAPRAPAPLLLVPAPTPLRHRLQRTRASTNNRKTSISIIRRPPYRQCRSPLLVYSMRVTGTIRLTLNCTALRSCPRPLHTPPTEDHFHSRLMRNLLRLGPRVRLAVLDVRQRNALLRTQRNRRRVYHIARLKCQPRKHPTHFFHNFPANVILDRI